MTTLVWVAVAMALAATVIRGNWVRIAFGPSASCLAAGALSLLVFSSAAWSAAGRLPAGDEPHYLIITQSLLLDHATIDGNTGAATTTPTSAASCSRTCRRGERRPDLLGALARTAGPRRAGVRPRRHRGVVLFLVVLAGFGSALAWHWRGAVRRTAPRGSGGRRSQCRRPRSSQSFRSIPMARRARSS